MEKPAPLALSPAPMDWPVNFLCLEQIPKALAIVGFTSLWTTNDYSVMPVYWWSTHSILHVLNALQRHGWICESVTIYGTKTSPGFVLKWGFKCSSKVRPSDAALLLGLHINIEKRKYFKSVFGTVLLDPLFTSHVPHSFDSLKIPGCIKNSEALIVFHNSLL